MPRRLGRPPFPSRRPDLLTPQPLAAAPLRPRRAPLNQTTWRLVWPATSPTASGSGTSFRPAGKTNGGRTLHLRPRPPLAKASNIGHDAEEEDFCDSHRRLLGSNRLRASGRRRSENKDPRQKRPNSQRGPTSFSSPASSSAGIAPPPLAPERAPVPPAAIHVFPLLHDAQHPPFSVATTFALLHRSRSRFGVGEEECRSLRFVSHSQEEAMRFAKYSTTILFISLLFRGITLHFLITKLVPLDRSCSADIESALFLEVLWHGFVLTATPEPVTQDIA
ncbi:hypothetical protein NL676_027821 [Syzygium grande]|nr:hypothetical protein NL676_027821 [Syzygium grande]